jgi:hypothetical protein
VGNVTINGFDVIEARLTVPRFGAWTADVVVDALTAANVATGSPVDLELAGGAMPFKGTSYLADAYAQTVTLRVVGGTNGLAKDCTPAFYRGCAIRLPIGDLMKAAGETLSSTSDQASLNTQLVCWTMMQQKVSLALSSLAMAGPDGAVWRVLQDGSIFFGVDSFAVSPLTDFELIDYLPQEGMQVIAAEVPNVFPGQSFNSRNVSDVEHTINAHGSRAKVWFE